MAPVHEFVLAPKKVERNFKTANYHKRSFKGD
jgi:hypothetical protein